MGKKNRREEYMEEFDSEKVQQIYVMSKGNEIKPKQETARGNNYLPNNELWIYLSNGATLSQQADII